MNHKGESRMLLTVAALVALFAVGWWLSVENERRLEHAAELTSQQQRLEVARAVVGEGLESLREREDKRPFYHYNPLYSPPDVIALSDPLVVSPLASLDDKRVVAHFQIDPGGEVRTPYDIDDSVSARTQDVRTRMVHEDFALLRDLVSPEPPKKYITKRIPQQKKRRVKKEPDATTETLAQHANPQAKQNANDPPSQNAEPQQQALNEPAQSDNYTVSLNQWSKQLYSDIQNNVAPSGGSSRSAPRITRRTVPEKDSSLRSKKVQTQQQNAAPQNPKGKKLAALSAKVRGTKAKTKTKRKTPRQRTTRVLLEQNHSLPKGPSATVLYTPISFARLGPELVLYRAVTHEGLTSVQGVILDEDALKDDWIPEILSRHSEEPIVLVNSLAEASQCLLSTPVNELFKDARFCLPATSFTEPSVFFQKAALFLLLALTALLLFTIARTQKRARALTQRRSDFIASVSHELRTPLTTLRMNAEMLRDKLVSPKNETKFLNTMVGESVRLSNLVENVLEIARFDQARRPLHKSDINIDTLFHNVCETQRAYCEGRGVRLDVKKSGLAVNADQKSLEQILVNLVENAVKYGAPKEGVHTVTLSAEEEESALVLKVSDRGIGIPVADHKRVFERFVRAREKGDTVVGTGIGLSLVKDLAQAHGGDAFIEASDVGATLCVRLPKA